MPHHFAERVLASFDKQSAMHLIKATIPVIEHGMTEIHVPHWAGIEQQHIGTAGGGRFVQPCSQGLGLNRGHSVLVEQAQHPVVCRHRVVGFGGRALAAAAGTDQQQQQRSC